MTADMEAQPVGPIQDDACQRCQRPQAEHRRNFMDMRDGVINHNYEQPPLRPYDHEVVSAMITTEWHCHRCHQHNDVWGDGAIEGYMECGHCGAFSWLVFDPPGFEAHP